MTRHTLHIPDLPLPGDRVRIAGDEASHALRVKRLQVGDVATAFDGAGSVGEVRVVSGGRDLEVEVVSTRHFQPETPSIEVWSATPKGPRLGDLVDLLSQVGVTSWTAMRTARANIEASSIRQPRFERITLESMKQCRRPWAMKINAPSSFDRAIEPMNETALVLADSGGEPYSAIGNTKIRLLIGPEGGWTDEERRRAIEAGAIVRRFGPHIMRIELAAAVASAITLDHERRGVAAHHPA